MAYTHYTHFKYNPNIIHKYHNNCIHTTYYCLILFFINIANEDLDANRASVIKDCNINVLQMAEQQTIIQDLLSRHPNLSTGSSAQAYTTGLASRNPNSIPGKLTCDQWIYLIQEPREGASNITAEVQFFFPNLQSLRGRSTTDPNQLRRWGDAYGTQDGEPPAVQTD